MAENGIDPAYSFGAPTVSARGGLYTLRFQPAYGNITIDVSRIKESSRGDVTAEFSVKGNPIGAGRQVRHLSRLNMLSASTKRSTAKELFDTAPDYLDAGGWRSLLERTCIDVLDLHRQGAPVVDMATHELTYSGPRYRIGPLARRASSDRAIRRRRQREKHVGGGPRAARSHWPGSCRTETAHRQRSILRLRNGRDDHNRTGEAACGRF